MALEHSNNYTNARLPLWREPMAGVEWASLHWSPAYLGVGIHRGQGEPIVLVPGFMASDVGLVELKCWLERMGFATYYSGIGRNLKCPRSYIETIAETVERAFLETGRRATIVGHSLGGCLARGVAIDRADLVQRVITLGSPIEGMQVHPLIFAAGERLQAGCDESCFLPLQRGLSSSVEEVCMYSKTDGVVDWHTSRRVERALNIEVRGTHIGLIWNPTVYREIARAVATKQRSPRRRERAQLLAA